MYRYYVTTDRIAELVLSVKRLVADFMDYGMKIHTSGGVLAFGWIKTTEPLSNETVNQYELRLG